MGHVKIRNVKTGGVWLCPAGVADQVLDSKDPFFGSSWRKAAESAELTDEQPAVAAVEVETKK